MYPRLSFVVVFIFSAVRRKRPGISPGPSLFLAGADGLEIHPAAAHAAHSAAAGHTAALALLLRNLGDHRLGGDQQACDRSRALDRRTHDLGRVDDALADEIAVFAGLRVEAPVVLVLLEDLADNDRAVFAGIGGDLAGRGLDRLADDLDAVLLVFVGGLHPLEGLGRAQQRDAAARQNAFLDRGAGCMHRVVDAILALLHLNFGRPAHADHCNTTGEFRQSLLELLYVIVGRRLLDLHFDLRDTCFDVGFLTGAANDRG